LPFPCAAMFRVVTDGLVSPDCPMSDVTAERLMTTLATLHVVVVELVCVGSGVKLVLSRVGCRQKRRLTSYGSVSS